MIELNLNGGGLAIAIICAVIVAGRIIARATENKVDNKIFNTLHKIGKAMGLKFRKRQNVLLLFCLPVALAGCQTLQDTSCVQRVGTVQSTIASAASTTEELFANNKISESEAVTSYQALSAARDAANRADNFCDSGDPAWKSALTEARGFIKDAEDEIGGLVE